MAIVFPRALPSLRMIPGPFDLQRNDVTPQEASGRLISVERATPLWRATFATTCRNEAEWGVWTAWTSSLKGAAKRFYGRDLSRKYPLYYRTGFDGLLSAGGSAFIGVCGPYSLNSTRDEITLTNLPPSLRLTYGDYVGLVWGAGAKHSLHRILTDANANLSGVGAWNIEPSVSLVVPADATPQLSAPVCLMRIVPGTLDLPREWKNRPVRFEAIQDLVP